MTFELPPNVSTSAELRELEQNAPNVTPKSIRAALVSAAKALESHEKASQDVVRILEEAMRLKVGQMDSQSRAHEVERAVKAAMIQAVARLNGSPR